MARWIAPLPFDPVPRWRDGISGWIVLPGDSQIQEQRQRRPPERQKQAAATSSNHNGNFKKHLQRRPPRKGGVATTKEKPLQVFYREGRRG